MFAYFKGNLQESGKKKKKIYTSSLLLSRYVINPCLLPITYQAERCGVIHKQHPQQLTAPKLTDGLVQALLIIADDNTITYQVT